MLPSYTQRLNINFSLSPLPPFFPPSIHSTEPLTYKDKLTSHLLEEEGDWNLLEVAGMAEETELITDGMANLNLLEKRAIVAKRKEKARKELMKVNNHSKFKVQLRMAVSPKLLSHPTLGYCSIVPTFQCTRLKS